jgi:triphosphatase
MSQQKEIELKFEVRPTNIGALDRVAFLKGIKPRKAKTVVSVYFDTDKQNLRRKGVSLRVRRVDGRHLQTIKESGNPTIGLFQRNEWECDIEGEQPDFALAHGTALEPLLSKKVRRNLKPVFETKVRRRIYPIRRAGSEIELTVDSGEVKAADRSASICELELDLRKGEPGELFRIARAIGEVIPVQLATKSKAGHGYDLMNHGSHPVRAEPIALPRHSNWGSAFQVIAQACLHQIGANEAALQRGDFEAVHQMRIGIRRLRAAISIFKDILAGSQTETIKLELKWLAGELGAVREIDVFIKRFMKAAKNKQAKGAGAGAVLEDFERERNRAMHRAKSAVASPRFRRLLVDAAAWIEAGDWQRSDDDLKRTLSERPVVDAATAELRRRWKKIRKRGAKLADLDVRRRHRLRIAAKKLRYANEFFASIFPSKKSTRRRKNMIAKLEAMQDGLGELNDIVVHEQLAKRAIQSHGQASERIGRRTRKAFAAGRFSGREAALVDTILKDAKHAYGAFAKARPFWQ